MPALDALVAPAPYAPETAPHRLWRTGRDFLLESGEAIEDFAVSYVTHGRLNAARDNAVLMVTAIGGNHHRLDFLIGPGKGLDPERHFIICADAIGNGLTSSPSNSARQPGLRFPRFTIRDMVESQYALLTEHFGLDRVLAVIGPSMGGMQALQWGVSHPGFMAGLIPIAPLAKVAPWTVGILQATRKAIMLDPVWNGGVYDGPPEHGLRLCRDILNLLAGRCPENYRDMFPADPLDAIPWIERMESMLLPACDANDWIYQTWAYERHDIATTPSMDGDMARALRAIRATTLMLTCTKDLLNPEYEPEEAARLMPDCRVLRINPGVVRGHAAGGGFEKPDVDWLNRTIADFLAELVARG
ncbi:MAG: alpha/beta fold hydrolase [Acetobacteraceae bacterium]|nr:alpha/beta fold hydrolase [Acetobacteraceae bacterium]